MPLIGSDNNKGGETGRVGFFKSIFNRSKSSKIVITEESAKSVSPGEKLPHEFIWKYGGQEVLLYGDWDDWQKGVRLQPRLDGDGCSTTLILDPRKPWTFKYVVDGEWRCTLDLPTVQDTKGNVNNILHPI